MNVTVDVSELEARLNTGIAVDDRLKEYAHARLAAYCEPYVPMETGTLARPKISAECITYDTPYAHYLYEGEIYGPNIPIRSPEGIIVGYFSMPGKQKHPTGRPLTYSKEIHPLATDHWDEAAMAVRKDDLLEDIGEYIAHKSNE